MQTFIKHIITLFILSVFSFKAFAQQPKIETSIDTTYIRIGEQFHYNIKVNKIKGVVFPIKLEKLQNIEQLESKIDTLKNYLVKKYVLTSFDSGSFNIPQQQLFINKKRLLTDSLLIHVATIKVDTLKQNLYPIKAIQNEPKTWEDYKHHLKWLLPLLLLLLVAIAYYLYYRKNKEKIAEIKRTPYEIALGNLSELDKKQLWQNNKIKLYYIELTDILRTFIEEETKIPALESTTDELLETISDFRKIKKIKIKSSVVKQLANLLREADLVKFAKNKPLQDEITTHRRATKDIIDKLKNSPLLQLKLNEQKEELSEQLTLYKWHVPIINFKRKKITISVSKKVKEEHLLKQSYFWKVFNPVGNIFMYIPFLGFYLILIWYIIAIPLGMVIALVEKLLGKKPLHRGVLILNRNGELLNKTTQDVEQ